MSGNETGYVYILTNPSFREDWVKIGKSPRPVNVRSKELDNTAVPLPFEIYATIETKKYAAVEKLVHKTIDRLTNLRIRAKREFFNVAPQVALDIFYDIASTIDDAKVTRYHNNEPIVEEPDPCPAVPEPPAPAAEQDVRTKRARFRFSMVGIPVGELITFVPTGIQVKVASDNSVEYQGRLYKLSRFAHDFMPPDKRNTSGAYQGSKYFAFEGKILEDLRKEREGEGGRAQTFSKLAYNTPLACEYLNLRCSEIF